MYLIISNVGKSGKVQGGGIVVCIGVFIVVRIFVLLMGTRMRIKIGTRMGGRERCLYRWRYLCLADEDKDRDNDRDKDRDKDQGSGTTVGMDLADDCTGLSVGL